MPDRVISIAGQLILPGPAGAVRAGPGVLVIRGDRIAEIREGEMAPGSYDLGGPEDLVSPGFVDAHVHLPQFDSIGVAGLELLDWLDRVIFPAEARWADADYAGSMTRRVAGQLLSFGTTAVGAYATVHHEAAQTAIDALAEVGMSGLVGQVLMDRHAPAELIRPAGQLLKEAASLKARARIQPAITPRFAISCTDELLKGAGGLAAKTGQFIQTHLAETRAECRKVGELFGGISYVEVYRRAGLLTNRSILGHGIHLNEEDRGTLARAGSTIAHCPTANRFLRAGAMDLAGHEAAHVHVAVGSDVAGGPDRSMVRVARAMIETAQQQDEANRRPGPSPARAWRMITRGNAEHLGLDDAGELAVGRRADVILIRPGGVVGGAGGDGQEIISKALYGWDDRWVERVWIGGREVYARPGV